MSMKQNLLHVVWSTFSAFLVGIMLWFIRERLASYDFVWQCEYLTEVFSYERFMIFGIVLLGLPAGSSLGATLSYNYLSHVRPSIRAFILSFVLAAVAMGAMIGVVFLIESENCPRALYFLRGDIFLALFVVVAGAMGVLGYRSGSILK